MWGLLLTISSTEEEPETQREKDLPEVSQRVRARLSQEPPGSSLCSPDTWLGPGRVGGTFPPAPAPGGGSLRLHPG